MTVIAVDELKGHHGGTIDAILVTTGRTETALAAERDKFKLAAMRAGIHSTTEGGVTAVDHLINIINDNITGMKGIKHFFIMVFENLL